MKSVLFILFIIPFTCYAKKPTATQPTSGTVTRTHPSVLGLAPTMVSSSASAPCDAPELTAAIPRSPMGAAAPNLNSLNGQSRDQALLREVRRGAIPNHLRQLKPVVINNLNPNCAGGSAITICVMPDYLSVGNTDDHLVFPLGRDAAISAAAELGFILPTTSMVDNIYRVADVRLTPRPRTNYDIMTRSSEIIAHHQTIQSQLQGTNYQPGMLVAGSKKDIVITNRMLRQRDRIAIYGWHQPNNRPIQSLSLVHGANYADYSQAVRLISQTAYINGSPTSLKDLLENSACGDALVGDGNPNSRGGAGLDPSILSRFPSPSTSTAAPTATPAATPSSVPIGSGQNSENNSNSAID